MGELKLVQIVLFLISIMKKWKVFKPSGSLPWYMDLCWPHGYSEWFLKKISSKHLKDLKAIQKENVFTKCIVVSRDRNERIIDGIECHYYKNLHHKLWNKEF